MSTPPPVCTTECVAGMVARSGMWSGISRIRNRYRPSVCHPYSEPHAAGMRDLRVSQPHGGLLCRLRVDQNSSARPGKRKESLSGQRSQPASGNRPWRRMVAGGNQRDLKPLALTYSVGRLYQGTAPRHTLDNSQHQKNVRKRAPNTRMSSVSESLAGLATY